MYREPRWLGMVASGALLVACGTEVALYFASGELLMHGMYGTPDIDLGGAVLPGCKVYSRASAYVAKLTADGHHLWSRGTACDPFYRAVAPTSDGGVLLAGHTYPEGGPHGVLLEKLDASGSVLWTHNFKGSSSGWAPGSGDR
jgi:hypothetical protein